MFSFEEDKVAIFSQSNKWDLDSDLQMLAVNFRFISLMITALLLTACSGDDNGFPSYQTFSPPTAAQLSISPQAEVDTILFLDYQFNDAAGRPEGVSKINWYLDNKLQNSALQFTPRKQNEGQWLHFCVTPIAAYGNNHTGTLTCSIAALILPASGSAPTAENVQIDSALQPGKTVQGDYQYLDVDEDLEGNSKLIWALNTLEVAQGNSYTLPANSENSQLSFCVTPIALTGEPKTGVEVCDTKTVAGSYTAPTATSLLISPTPVTGNLLTGSYLFSDANSRTEGSSLSSWRLDGSEVATNTTLTLAATDEDKSLEFCVTPIAAYGQNATGTQSCTLVTNVAPKAGSAPVASSLAISSPLQPGQGVNASYLYSDADADIEASSLTLWRIDNVDSGTDLSLTLPVDSEGKNLELCVTPIALTGSPKQGSQVCQSLTIIGSYPPPTATSLLISPTPMTNTLLTGSYQFNDANSRPEGTSLISWKLDASEVATSITLTLLATDEDKNIEFCVTPIAAYGQNASGTQACTLVANADPLPGSAPSVTNLTWDTFAKPSTFLTLSYDFIDSDGDTEGVSLFSWKLDNIEVSQNISYTPSANSGGKNLAFCVTPVAVTGTPKIGSQSCITADIAAILLSGNLQLDDTLTLEIKGYTDLGVIWRSSNPSNNSTRSTSNSSFTISRGTPTESAFTLVSHDIEVCVTTAEEGELCSLASTYDSTEVTGGLPIAIDAGFNVTQRGVAPIPYADLTIGLITKRLHRPLTTVETSILNNAQPTVPLFDSQRAENGTSVFWGLFTWPNSNTHCLERGYSLTVDGINDTSDAFGLRQYYDHIVSLYPALPSTHVSLALGWGTNADYYWSISDVGGGSHADVYMVSGALGSITDTRPEYAACIETLP
ncbi:hypothetical protein Sps_02089 [Shewanella psychrophila]|uniref:Uncharacterized protein n=1 Tax=Shewanella psychrophila TaxID=225848 RepID=A0A1S6HP24_9GAMM|nr:hypothetical protein Sps_02089 [Shewanella psychrophila]